MPDKVTSKDGTIIAYERVGQGPSLLVITGAFNDRSKGAPLAAALAGQFTVFSYDRRGRGDSGDTLPYAIGREVEDIAAMLEAAGGSALVLGFSSGAVLALYAAAAGLAIDKLALMEAPLIADAMRPGPPADFVLHLKRLVDAGRRGDAVESFQLDLVGIPRHHVEQMRNAPFRPGMEAMAHTLVYDATIIGDMSIPQHIMSAVRVPTLVLDGNSAPWMRRTAETIAAGLADGTHISIPELGHEISPVLAPILSNFFMG